MGSSLIMCFDGGSENGMGLLLAAADGLGWEKVIVEADPVYTVVVVA